MTATLEHRPILPARPGDGGTPARRAMIRWSLRLFRREWRQQVLVLSLLTVAVAATTLGLAVASHVVPSPDGTFGSANNLLTVPGSDPELASDIAAAQKAFGPTEVIYHQSVAVPGSVTALDIRAENPKGLYGSSMLRLDSGRYPTGPGQVAVTTTIATTLGLHLGGVWTEDGRPLTVVGTVENPLNLLDQFALVAPGQASPPTSVSILFDASDQQVNAFRLPSGTGMSVDGRGTVSSKARAMLVLILSSVGLLFVGLVSVAGFTVLAQRRLRAMGMLGALGATDRHLRLTMLANGAIVGFTGAVVGAILGLAGWLAFAPVLETLAEQRVNRFDLPWWAIGAAMALAVVTSVLSAWWPARSATRIPVVAALAGHPPQPQPVHRSAAAGVGAVLAGVTLLALSHQRHSALIIAGIAATVLGVLFLAPLAISALAAVGGRAPIAARMALRDLARYQARSGAALGAVTLAIGIAATIVVSAAAAQKPATAGNLPSNEINIYLGSSGLGPVPVLTAGQLHTLQNSMDRLASDLDAKVTIPLEVAVDPNEPVAADQPGPGGGPGGRIPAQLDQVTYQAGGFGIALTDQPYVATPALLSHLGIKAGQINPAADIVTSRTDLQGLELVAAINVSIGSGGNAAAPGGGRVPPTPEADKQPTIQVLEAIPAYTSGPDTLITMHAMQTLGLQSAPAGWIIETPRPLTPAQIGAAQKLAAADGLSVETRKAQTSLAQLGDWSTAVGLLLALGILAMTVGLIRSETANDLRTLTATGASATTRRSLTGVTAGSLALLGAVLGTGGAYAGLLAWHRNNLHVLTNVPVANLVAILAGLPLLALVAGWLLAGRQPGGMARQPTE